MIPGRPLRTLLPTLLALAAPLPLASAWQRAEFPPVSKWEEFPAESGIRAAALEALAGTVQAFVDEGRAVGAELHVIAHDRTLLHRAFGWKDREEDIRMETGTVFNVRSMTKPIVGTLAQQLIGQGKLGLEDPVATVLGEFDSGRAKEITIDHLLTHRSGLLWTACADSASLRELANCAAKLGPTQFIPGTSWLYSNTGTNVLAAALVEVGGGSLESLVTERVLEPLGMRDTFSLASASDELLERCASLYISAKDGSLERAWSPAKGVPLPFLQGAHGLATTTTDYARFLDLWLDDGVVGEQRLLSAEAVTRALRPRSLTELPTTFPDRRVYYGQHWVVRTLGETGAVESFGHSGSDGTFSWVFPERDLIVLYFTQVTNSTTGIELEAEIDRLLLTETAAEEVSDPRAAYVGHFWREKEGLVRVVTLGEEDAIELDVVGTGAFELKPTDDPLRWEIPGRPDFDVHFVRDEAGVITHLIPPARTGEGNLPRLRPDALLPSVAELMELRLGADGFRAPSALAMFKMTGHFLEDGEKSWQDVLYSDGDQRSREEVHRSKRGPQVTICNGDRACSESRTGRQRLLSGALRIMTISGRLAVLIGDWRRYYVEVNVLARTEREGREHYIVQAIPAESSPTYYLVDAETGDVAESYITVDIPFGSMAKISTYNDYRDVDGVSIPFHWAGRFASEGLGEWELQYEEIETHLEVDESLFEIEE